MPLMPSRLQSRGFNQALEIARELSRLTGVPLAANACRRVRDGAPHAELPWGERERNIRRTFVCDADLRNQRIAVIDAVLTPGATLNALAHPAQYRRARDSRVDGSENGEKLAIGGQPSVINRQLKPAA